MAKLTPFPFQREDLATLRRNNYTGLVAIEAGGGKTITATLSVMEAGPRVVLIVAPKSTHLSAWIPTIRDNAGREARIIGNDNKAQKAALMDFELGYEGVYLTTPQFLTRADVSTWSGDMLIVDEIHQLATPKSKGQRKLSGYHPSDGEPLSVRFRQRLALSGTPMRQQFENMWSIMRFLWPERSERHDIAAQNFVLWQADRQEWTEVYTSRRDKWGQPVKVKQYLAEREPGRLVREMPCVIIHKRRETCCAHHPGGFLPTDEPQVIEREVSLTAAQRRSIREMEEMMMTYLNDNPLVTDIPLTQKQRIRQLTLGEADARTFIKDGEEKTTIEFDPKCKSPFLDETLHILSNLPDDENVIVYLESQRFAQVVVSRLNEAGIPAAEYSGVRKADLSRFGKDYRALVGVVSAIGTGTNGLQSVCNTEVWIEQPISLTNRNQTYARLDRMGGKQVQRYVLLDDLGVQSGRIEDMMVSEHLVNRSLRLSKVGA